MLIHKLPPREDFVCSRPQEKIAQYAYLYVAPTECCGFGLFTARPARTHDVVLRVEDPHYLSRARPRAYLSQLGLGHADMFQVGHDLFLPPYGGLDDFTNHNCDPNCGLRVNPTGFEMIALRDIDAGQELFYDYSTHQEHPLEDMDCRCGSLLCRGVVRSFSTLPDALRQRYLDLGIVAGFIAENDARARANR